MNIIISTPKNSLSQKQIEHLDIIICIKFMQEDLIRQVKLISKINFNFTIKLVSRVKSSAIYSMLSHLSLGFTWIVCDITCLTINQT